MTLNAVTVWRDLLVSTSAGNDILSLVRVNVVRKANLNTGADDDQVAVRDSIFFNAFYLITGGGGDLLDFNLDATATASLRFVGRTTVNAGAGADTFNLGGPNVGTPVVFGTFTRLDGGTGNDTLTTGSNVSDNGTLVEVNWNP